MAFRDDYCYDRAYEQHIMDREDDEDDYCDCHWTPCDDGTYDYHPCDTCGQDAAYVEYQVFPDKARRHWLAQNQTYCENECESCNFLRTREAQAAADAAEAEQQQQRWLAQYEQLSATYQAAEDPDEKKQQQQACKAALDRVASIPSGNERIEAIRAVLRAVSAADLLLQHHVRFREAARAKCAEYRADPLGGPLLDDIAALEAVLDRFPPN
jgi:hypothetical protein